MGCYGAMRLLSVSRRAQVARTNREGRGLAGSRLGLRNRVTHQDERLDRTLLDGRRLLETVGVDTTEEILLQAHVVEALGNCTRKQASAQSCLEGEEVWRFKRLSLTLVPVGLHQTIIVKRN